jgi:hypothetical protein
MFPRGVKYFGKVGGWRVGVLRVRLRREDDRLIRPESVLAKCQGDREEYTRYSRRDGIQG